MGRDVPPWQRSPASRASQKQAPRTPARDTNRPESRGGPAGHVPGADDRLNRFISGGASTPAPAEPAESAPPRSEPVVNEAYASELPDLSGGRSRPSPRTTAL